MSTAHPEADVQRLCRLAGISRASFYRHREESDPDAADHDLQEAIQHICLRHKYYGYRRVTATLRRQGHRQFGDSAFNYNRMHCHRNSQ